MTDNPKFEIIDGDFPEAGRIEGDGWTVSIRYDDYPDNPRDWTDCWIGTMMTSHRNYNFGNDDHDIQLNDAPDTEITCPRCEGSGESADRFVLWHKRMHGFDRVGSGSEESMQSEADALGVAYYVDPDVCPKCKGEGQIDVGLIEYIKRTYGATVILPIYLYDHSGLSMSAGTFGENPGYPYNDQWDAGMVGVIFDTPEQIEKTGIDPDPKNIESALRSEIEEYDQYLRGEVYYISESIPGMENKEDSITGFIGEEYAFEEAKRMAEACDQLVQRERAERKRWEERDVCTVRKSKGVTNVQ